MDSLNFYLSPGYSTYTLGVKSNIRLKSMKNMNFPHIDVEIVPALPSLEVSLKIYFDVKTFLNICVSVS